MRVNDSLSQTLNAAPGTFLFALSPLSTLALFPLSWRHFSWTGTPTPMVVGWSILLGGLAVAPLPFLVTVNSPIFRFFVIPFGFLVLCGAAVGIGYPEWVRRPEVVPDTGTTESEPHPEPAPDAGATDSSPDLTPTNGGTDAPTDDSFAAASPSSGGRAAIEQSVETSLAEQSSESASTPANAPPLGPPDHVPRAPDLAVDYADLTDKEPIGRGGNADVYRATVRDGQTVAVKEPRMSGTLHSDAVDRMLAEAETWDKLDDHDHVVGVVDYGADPLPWIAMEYMDAGDLSARAGDLPFEQALWTAEAITEGVRHAHRRGVAHLDLKPGNVLFRSVDGAWDVPKVADWGLSKHLLDHSQSVEGLSPQYAAPEQFDTDRGPADDLTDVYQLGAVLYELVTGRPPFEGDPTTVMHRVLHEDPAPPSAVADVPEALDDVLLTALATEKADRYDSVLYLRDAFRDLAER
ncbi:serine/threonine-protein kinase [Haloplanus halophilus]|uniref:serine/threonine-protein kinase n=1 Tax=Haloplanus halophilus TaxID=2949993 RepID=UPI00203D5266|nr:serine/threonine-protein kinase [Haloplanus sp. GDY1]